MLKNEKELEHSIQTIARLMSLRDREAVEPSWDEETRQEISDETRVLIGKIEREIAEYLAEKYHLVREDATVAAEKAA